MSDPENPLEASPAASTSKTSVIHRIVSTSLAQPLLVLAASAILVGVGIWSFSRLPIDAYPDLSPTLVGITTQWPGQAAEEVERLTSVPIETEMNGLPGIQTIRSISLFGLSSVDLIFKDGVDPYFAREQVFQRLAGVSLPDGVSADVEPLFSPSGLVYRYVLTSPDRNPMELKTLNDWVLSKAYKAVPGVADMSGFGGPTMQYQVLIDPTRLAGAGLAVSDVVTALSNNNGNAGGGFYSEGGQFYYVRGLGRLETPDDIGNVVLTVRNGAPILVKDVGTVEIGFAPRLGLFGFNKNDDAVEGVILMRTGEQAQTVLKGVERKTNELNSGILPKDVKVKPFYDRSDLIELTTRTVEDNLLRGIILVVAVLIFFLFDIRSGLIVAVTIPLALLFAFICLDARHIPANLLSIGAIDFGILVDGAVVMVENIHRTLARRHGTSFSIREVIAEAAAEVDRPIVYAVAIIVAGFLPIYVLTGPSGTAVHPDGRHHDLRPDWRADPRTHDAAGALRAGPAGGRHRAPQSGVRMDPRPVRERTRRGARASPLDDRVERGHFRGSHTSRHAHRRGVHAAPRRRRALGAGDDAVDDLARGVGQAGAGNAKHHSHLPRSHRRCVRTRPPG